MNSATSLLSATIDGRGNAALVSFGKLAYDFLLHLVTLFHAFSAGKGHLAGVGAAGSETCLKPKNAEISSRSGREIIHGRKIGHGGIQR